MVDGVGDDVMTVMAVVTVMTVMTVLVMTVVTVLVTTVTAVQVGKAEFLGRALARPRVFLEEEVDDYYPPKLEWLQISRGSEEVGGWEGWRVGGW